MDTYDDTLPSPPPLPPLSLFLFLCHIKYLDLDFNVCTHSTQLSQTLDVELFQRYQWTVKIAEYSTHIVPSSADTPPYQVTSGRRPWELAPGDRQRSQPPSHEGTYEYYNLMNVVNTTNELYVKLHAITWIQDGTKHECQRTKSVSSSKKKTCGVVFTYVMQLFCSVVVVLCSQQRVVGCDSHHPLQLSWPQYCSQLCL